MNTLTIGHPVKGGAQYQHRTAVRCIVTRDNEICIVYVNAGKYYKLPGGGVEADDKDHSAAAQREALEETGCEVSVAPQVIAKTIEYRGDLEQESYAYVCTVTKDTGKVDLTEQEIAEGLMHEWCPLAEALRKMQESEPTSELGKFIKERDMFILQTCADGL